MDAITGYCIQLGGGNQADLAARRRAGPDVAWDLSRSDDLCPREFELTTSATLFRCTERQYPAVAEVEGPAPAYENHAEGAVAAIASDPDSEALRLQKRTLIPQWTYRFGRGIRRLRASRAKPSCVGTQGRDRELRQTSYGARDSQGHRPRAHGTLLPRFIALPKFFRVSRIQELWIYSLSVQVTFAQHQLATTATNPV